VREIKVIHDPDAEQEERRVEDFDCDGVGNTAVAIFAGPFAESRAGRIAEWLATNTD
jgi:hypothetical protein